MELYSRGERPKKIIYSLYAKNEKYTIVMEGDSKYWLLSYPYRRSDRSVRRISKDEVEALKQVGIVSTIPGSGRKQFHSLSAVAQHLVGDDHTFVNEQTRNQAKEILAKSPLDWVRYLIEDLEEKVNKCSIRPTSDYGLNFAFECILEGLDFLLELKVLKQESDLKIKIQKIKAQIEGIFPKERKIVG